MAGPVMVAVSFRPVAIAIALVFGTPAFASAAAPPPAATGEAPLPPKVHDLLILLDDPTVRGWIEQQRNIGKTPAEPPTEQAETVASDLLASRITAAREHLRSLVMALPTLPDELQRVGDRLFRELRAAGDVGVLLLLAGFAALGFGFEWLFARTTAGLRRHVEQSGLATVGDRLRAMIARFALNAGQVLAFAIGSIGAFLAFPWPEVLRQIVLGYLTAFLALRVALAAARFLLAPPGYRAPPDVARFRIIPMSNDAARFWTSRIGALVGWFAFGYITLGLLNALGLPPAHRRLVAYILGLGLLAMGFEIAWRRPRRRSSTEAVPSVAASRVRHNGQAWMLSGYFLLIWLLWVLSAMNAFWLAVVLGALPVAIRVTDRAAEHLLRPPGQAHTEASLPSIRAVCLERGARTVLFIGAVVLLAQKWGIDIIALTAGDTLATRLLRGALNATVILLVADFVWHVLKAIIDRKLAEAQDPGQPDTDEARRRARIRTLLPVARNILFVLMIAIAAMMALASMGVEIGPLIAGAGVVGVAIGFGAQTLVRDIISGMFYLLDDAFRVGEYIQSGNYKGTVESFSLRSVKLRHHRGPLYTVPFGVLGAVQNMSRDWVIDKISVGVTYDSDLDKAKKLVKQIGKELAEDPEYGPDILEPLKMQGVDQFGDYAIQLRMKIMTRPGQQFAIRRRAYAMIKKAFDANGIKFAFPTVQVAGGESATGAVARQGLELVKRPVQPA